MATAIFFASSTGNSEEIANKIASKLGDIEVFDLAGTKIDKINEYDKLILGGSTWGDGELNDDWEDKWADFCKLDLSNKTIALFGLGDQESYGSDYVSGMRLIFNKVMEKGVEHIGAWEDKGYAYEHSASVIDGMFVGLALDEDNQSELTAERIDTWCKQLKEEMRLSA